jgi:hypothetical protein
MCSYPLPLTVDEEVRLCLRCYVNLPKGKFSAQVYFNNMNPPEAPQPIKDLSNVEAQMLSQVRPFMKIYKLCKGRGQYAVKGGITHFPNSVKDVCLQLPLTANQAGIIVVTESTETIGHCRDMEVRPAVLYCALAWLKENNPLYRNATTSSHHMEVEQHMQHVVCEGNISEINYVAMGSINHFQKISGNRLILRASFHQGSEIFPLDTAGRQCTAMAMTSIAYACVQTPSTWDSEVMNANLIHGDKYFAYKSPSRTELMATEAAGIIENVFDGPSIELVSHEDESEHAGLNKLIRIIPRPINFDEMELMTASQLISKFISSERTAAILTVGGYSISLFKDSDSVFIFDSHSRGPSGGVSSDGLACIIQFPMSSAAQQVSDLLHLNYQTKADLTTEESRNTHIISLVPVSYHETEEMQHIMNEEEAEISLTKENSLRTEKVISSNRQTFGERIDSDSVLHAIDNNAPDVQC